MRRVSAVGVVAWCVVFAGGCAAISGLDQIQESDCAPHCDGGGGSADDVTTPIDRAAPEDAPSMLDVNETSQDAVVDRGTPKDAAEDAPEDAPLRDAQAEASDAPVEVDAADATSDVQPDVGVADASDASSEAEAGCGPTNTTDNCSACGVKCAGAPTANSASCTSGTSCTYQCSPTHLDCNASSAPNTDGCECSTPGAISATCCGTSCPTAHVTGFATGPSGRDQTFYDCETTLDAQAALDACTAYSGPGNCQTNTMFNSSCPANPDGGARDLVVCNFLAGISQTCVCWDYQGNHAGFVFDSGSVSNCVCPTGGAGNVPFH